MPEKHLEGDRRQTYEAIIPKALLHSVPGGAYCWDLDIRDIYYHDLSCMSMIRAKTVGLSLSQ